MTEMGDRRDHSVPLERLEGQLTMLAQKVDLTSKNILDKIEFTDNNARQLVNLLRTEFTQIQKDIARIEATQRRHQQENHEAFSAIDVRLTTLEGFKNRLMGAVGFASIFASVLTAALLKAFGI